MFLSQLALHNGERDLCFYGRGFVDISHRPDIDEPPPWLQSEVTDEDWARIQRWPYIFWLRDVQIARTRAGSSVWLSDLNSRGDVIPRKSLSQHSHIRLRDDQVSSLNAALETLFQRAGTIVIESPNDIWWNQHTQDPRKRITRVSLEIAYQGGLSP